mmetsp:Transcript_33120/g.84225  ORF Transcript_33120/g.84225 Transcript_33120/m.84225 type:complete len:215 (+) Transcript_33120:352-996(+)
MTAATLGIHDWGAPGVMAPSIAPGRGGTIGVMAPGTIGVMPPANGIMDPERKPGLTPPGSEGLMPKPIGVMAPGSVPYVGPPGVRLPAEKAPGVRPPPPAAANCAPCTRMALTAFWSFLLKASSKPILSCPKPPAVGATTASPGERPFGPANAMVESCFEDTADCCRDVIHFFTVSRKPSGKETWVSTARWRAAATTPMSPRFMPSTIVDMTLC